MLLTEWNIEEAKEVWREEALEEGRVEGREEGREAERNYVLELLAQGLSAEEIKRRLTSKEFGISGYDNKV